MAGRAWTSTYEWYAHARYALDEGIEPSVIAALAEHRTPDLRALPAEDAIALNRRQVGCLADARDALGDAARAEDVVLVAENLRIARTAFDRLTGRAGVEDMLDALFGRFCLGK